ncbi:MULTISPECIES: YggT family protein [unclassified Pseudomonas]|uniref:YggT family protein n=1 Tax=unclassified Pseudomonas TaxID=196821 RepID=UPI002AC8E15E|nr:MULTISPECIES: YggT family protein [unclassified Pseudomonas]MEB0039423.1 YggT family protein [Pseudomonas sp. MH10]MEB0079271.1 YggT family protein [Pseudomonas sp. MH10out]MEB0092616.1 YggT family protein [Pseudomonas sp. CCI4.2]MEB0102544.1 YggT family protein [Pseudomonas sp. CCI3.2]MEB0119136.1 YggT family protein [Pseudomonas sp. CCI1.2]
MNALTGALIFVVQTLVSLYLAIVLLRFVLQLVKANFYNPLCQFAVRATQPLLKPIRRIIPSVFGLDTSSLLLAIIIQALLMALVLTLTFGTIGDVPHLLIWSIIGVTSLFLKIFWVAMIVMVIVSWVAPGSHNPAAELAYQISEPVLAPFRRLIPNLGGMDISPIFAFIAIQVIQSYVMPPLATYAQMPDVLWRLI